MEALEQTHSVLRLALSHGKPLPNCAWQQWSNAMPCHNPFQSTPSHMRTRTHEFSLPLPPHPSKTPRTPLRLITDG